MWKVQSAVGLGGAALLTTTVTSVFGPAPAAATATIPSPPRIDAVDFTPRVVDDSTVTEAGVRDIEKVGGTVYAGGAIRTVLDASGARNYQRSNLFSFSATTGAVTAWAPAVNGHVYALEPSPDGRYLYVGGDFWNVNGQSVNKLVKFDLTTGALVAGFRSPVTAGRISDLEIVNGRLFVSGSFPGGIVALDPTTGARTSYFDQVQVSGAESGYSTRVYRFAVNPSRTKLVVIGSFTAVGGKPRQQAALITLSATTATVSPWYSRRWDEDCVSTLQWYSRDVDWAPSGDRFVIVTTGAGFPGTPKLCDTASAWAAVDAPEQQPLWVQYSGGDTFHSVQWTDKAVFLGGHFRWLDNPQGRDFAGPGAVNRKGLGAVDPLTGGALAWDPTKSIEGGLGAFDLHITDQGLWVAHFERYLGRNSSGAELHQGLGLLPY